MCFTIPYTAKPRKQRYAYKIMCINNHRLNSEFFHEGGGYYEGQIVKRNRGPTRLGGVSSHGMYVYNDLKTARRESRFSPSVIVKVLVDPKDLLFISACGTMATYEKITIAPNKDQPEIEFYY